MIWRYLGSFFGPTMPHPFNDGVDFMVYDRDGLLVLHMVGGRVVPLTPAPPIAVTIGVNDDRFNDFVKSITPGNGNPPA